MLNLNGLIYPEVQFFSPRLTTRLMENKGDDQRES